MFDAQNATNRARQAAIPKGDIETLCAIHLPDARIWHDHDQATRSVEQNLQVLASVVKNIAGRRYEEIRRHATPTGFVQQHVLRGRAPNGAPLEVPACIVCAVAGGRITRLDEYLDSAQLEALRG
ncbi:MAG: ketosteroid isomerase [Deltaproteobacteria bacterium]|nr:ketosteroid isomerase [Deltaproteobacteria bacterium]